VNQLVLESSFDVTITSNFFLLSEILTVPSISVITATPLGFLAQEEI